MDVNSAPTCKAENGFRQAVPPRASASVIIAIMIGPERRDLQVPRKHVARGNLSASFHCLPSSPPCSSSPPRANPRDPEDRRDPEIRTPGMGEVKGSCPNAAFRILWFLFFFFFLRLQELVSSALTSARKTSHFCRQRIIGVRDAERKGSPQPGPPTAAPWPARPLPSARWGWERRPKGAGWGREGGRERR